MAFALVSPRAFAAAPMCDPSGASIVAPIPALPSSTGELSAPKGCDEPSHEWIETSGSRHDAPLAERSVDPPDRVIVVPATLPDPKGVSLPRPSATEGLRRPGFSTPVYRPPRA